MSSFKLLAQILFIIFFGFFHFATASVADFPAAKRGEQISEEVVHANTKPSKQRRRMAMPIVTFNGDPYGDLRVRNGEDTKRSYVVAPYFWKTTSKTTVTSDTGYTVPFELGVEDLVRAMNGGMAFIFEAREGHYVLSSEVSYMDADHVNTSVMTPIGKIPLVLDTRSVIVELWVGRHFDAGRDWIELFLGARQVETHADASAMGQSTKNHSEWHEPVVAMQLHKYITDRLAFDSRGSLGGFNDNKTSYDISGGFLYELKQKIYIITGYRYQRMRHEEDGQTPVDVRTYGPYIAIAKMF